MMGFERNVHLFSLCLVFILNLVPVISTTSTPPSTTHGITSTSSRNSSTETGTLPEKFLLFTEYSTGSIYRMDVTTQSYVKIPVDRIDKPSAIDYDPVEENIYFLDNVNHEIRQVSIHGNTEQIVLDLGDGEYNGIAVDPIARLIFYTSYHTPSIGVVAIDGFDHTTIIDSGQHVLWDIAVDAHQGIMYWTQCCEWNGKIRRALYDGSEIEDIITSDVPYPYAIALDTAGERIYWAESLREVIEYSFLNGSNRQLLYKGAVRDCLGITLLNGYVYYAEYKARSTLIRIQIDQTNATALTPRNFAHLRGVHAYNGSAPSESNVCTNGKGGCSHICIPFKGDKKCLCPTGQSLLPDAVSCGCSGNTFGTKCSTACDCINENTLNRNQSCDYITGRCNCLVQWNGTRCEQDVDECSAGFHNCTKGNEKCLNSDGGFRCICEDDFFRNAGGFCEIEFEHLPFPYGQTEGHKLFQVNEQDECIRVENVGCGFYVNDTHYDSFYICENGLVTFNKPYRSSSIPKSNNTKEFFIFAESLPLAPYFSSIDAMNGQGHIYYQVYTQEILDTRPDLKALFDGFIDVAVINTTDIYLLIVVTWENVHEYGKKTSKTSSFQLIIVANGVSDTFAFFAYLGGGMNFETGENFIGFASSSKVQNLNFRTANPVQTFVISGRSGLFLLNLNAQADLPTTDCRYCEVWLIQQQSSTLQPIYEAIWSTMPKCPCSRQNINITDSFALLDPEFFLTNESQCYGLKSAKVYGEHLGSICCYINNSYVSQSPNSGFKTTWNPLDEYYKTNYRNTDKIMRERCCRGGQCNSFYTYRPINGQCAVTAGVSLGAGVGDPHIRNFDGTKYTFNGHGEYSLVNIDSGNFLIQGRTQPYLNERNATVGATIFSAFAGEDKVNGGHFMISINNSKTGMDIVVNNNDLTSKFYNETPYYYTAADKTITLEKRERNKLVAYFTNLGVSVTVAYKGGILTISVIVPNNLSGQPRGLMGNSNGIDYDDFIARNGTDFGPNPNDRQLYEMGQTWLVNSDEDSAFLYPPGSTYRDYQDLNFVVNFLDEANPIKVNNARKFCGENNHPCIFDFVFTESNNFAKETRASVIQQDEKDIAIKDECPIISIDAKDLKTGTGVVQIEVGETKTIGINGTDDGTLEFKLSKGDGITTLEEADTINSVNMFLNFTTVDSSKEEISVVAIDNNAAESPILIIPIVLCSGCNRRGTCDYDALRPGQSGDSLVLAKCVCEPYYEDVNECTNATLNACDDICINTEGSFRCDCSHGYRVSRETKCEDINECEEASHDCIQICSNNNGSYDCSCYPGYIYNGTENSCTMESIGNCHAFCPTVNGGCFVEDNIPKCFCFSGFELKGNTCENINECDQAVCSQTCQDTHGSYLCGCYTGYKLNTDKTTCSVCPKDLWGENCANECDCSSLGTVRCNHIKGCVCNEQWTGLLCDEDVDECDLPNICDNKDKICVNTPGAFRCECISGYQPNMKTGLCEDNNECENSEENLCGQLCINTLGGYFCECSPGYRLNEDESTCSDIDECVFGDTGCEQECSNAIGSYRCLCYYGYLLNDDRRTCRRDSPDDLCVEEGLTCQGFCLVEGSSLSCRCGPGYIIGSDLQSCLDINECTDTILNKCRVKENCVNTDGNYDCSCQIGYQLDNDGKTCKICDKNHYGEACLEACDCGHGATHCDPISGCVCAMGWRGEKCNIDENECDVFPLPCTGRNSLCINTPGKYMCTCIPGLSLSPSGDCRDKDECSDGKRNSCDQICDNTLGSYKCSCHVGFRQIESACQDIDECSTMNVCDQRCLNTLGSYKCSCYSGFRLSKDDMKTCMPEEQCTGSQAVICDRHSSVCVVVDGKTACRCRKGYQKVNDTHCEDINECAQRTDVCNQNCSNTEGAYSCSCEVGYKLNNDLFSCLACGPDTYGNECRNKCTCATINTEYCDPVNGECYCLKGWKGMNCSENVNECEESTDVCPDNSTCHDIDGAYVCRCDSGYFKNDDGVCLGCSKTTFGINCEQKCECVNANTALCDPIDGTCTCKAGWTGDNCIADIDECEAGIKNPCVQQNRSICRNIIGQYRCDCDAGFELVDDYCEDTNECLRGESNCTQRCTNTVGGFVCSCNPGYTGRENSCAGCVTGRWGDNCSQICECDDEKSLSCDPGTGCVCKQGYSGSDCTHDIDECSTVKNACTTNSKCRNSYGSFTCTCLAGYLQINTSGQTKCVQCYENTYGMNCNETCDCLPENTFNPTQSCDHVTGQCDCRWQWNGTRCENDVNECTVGFDTCTKANETCLNTEGGFKCICEEGLTRNTTGYCNTAIRPLIFNNSTHRSVIVHIVLDVAIPPDVNLEDQSSNSIYKPEARQSLQTILDEAVNETQVTVNYVRESGIMQGILVVEFTVIFPKEYVIEVSIALTDVAAGKEIVVFNETGHALRLKVEGHLVDVGANTSLCAVYEAITEPCQQGYYCEEVEERPFCRKETNGGSVLLIIVLCTGIPLLVLSSVITSLVIRYLRMSKKSKKNAGYPKPFDDPIPNTFDPPRDSRSQMMTAELSTNPPHFEKAASTINPQHTLGFQNPKHSPVDPSRQLRLDDLSNQQFNLKTSDSKREMTSDL